MLSHLCGDPQTLSIITACLAFITFFLGLIASLFIVGQAQISASKKILEAQEKRRVENI